MKELNLKLNQKGQLTLDFLFGCVLILGVSILLAALTFALTLTEVVQYVSFAGARAYFAADYSPVEQGQAANAKVAALLSSLPFLMGAEKNKWIVLTQRGADNFGASYRDADIHANPTHSQFTGYQIKFNLPIVNLKLPLLGDVLTPPGNAQGFSATVSSFLMREPTFTECQAYNNMIYQALTALDSGYSIATQYGTPAANFVAINDNGC